MLKQWMIKDVLEAGCDEAGRGPLAGSVFAAAVILDEDIEGLEELNDSKQLTAIQRYALRPIIEKKALAWAVGEVSVTEIDQLNILNAAILAMHRALDGLVFRPQHILVDGNRFKPYLSENGLTAIPHQTVVKGDGKYMSIAAASVLAKTYRDDYMKRLSLEYPQYGWDVNFGYPTKQHQQALRAYGPTPYHRRSFRLVY